MNGSIPADRDTHTQDLRAPRAELTQLRRAIPIRMWGGKGCGVPCDFCSRILSETDVEYEIEAELDLQRVTLHFHPRCHDAWKAGREPPAPQTPQEPHPSVRNASR